MGYNIGHRKEQLDSPQHFYNNFFFSGTQKKVFGRT